MIRARKNWEEEEEKGNSVIRLCFVAGRCGLSARRPTMPCLVDRVN
jgi:hypothetical protein